MRIIPRLALSAIMMMLALAVCGVGEARETKGGGSSEASFEDFQKSLKAINEGGCHPGQEIQKKCGCEKGFAQKWSDQLTRDYSGKSPKSMCLQGVRTSFQKACWGSSGSGWVPSAKNAGACFAKLRFQVNDASVSPPEPPLPGTVFVFEGGPHGHIETWTGKEYCSDFCRKVRIDQKSKKRKLKSWFVPPEYKGDSKVKSNGNDNWGC